MEGRESRVKELSGLWSQPEAVDHFFLSFFLSFLGIHKFTKIMASLS